MPTSSSPYLSRGGEVVGAGGNRFEPLSAHGLGDKADRWSQVFDGARAIAIDSRHSLAIRTDNTLWAWVEGFGIASRQLLDRLQAVADGNTTTIALGTDSRLEQWEGRTEPHEASLP